MGLFRTVVMTVALVAGGRSLWRVRSICRPIHVPPDALLAPRASAQRHTYWDAYKVDVTDRALLLLKNTGEGQVRVTSTRPEFKQGKKHWNSLDQRLAMGIMVFRVFSNIRSMTFFCH